MEGSCFVVTDDCGVVELFINIKGVIVGFAIPPKFTGF